MITIVKAEKADAEDLLKVKVDAFAWDAETYGHGPPKYDSLEHQIKIFDNKKVRYFKIMDDEKLIGGISVIALGHRHYRLGGIYIATEYQNRGIGSQAIDFLFKEFPDAHKWTLETPYLNYRNHHFYEKLGFNRVGQTPPGPDGFYLYEYEKRIEGMYMY